MRALLESRSSLYFHLTPLIVFIVHAALAPYHKVEEGFATGGVYDIMESVHRSDRLETDWVPRSSIPIYILAFLSRISGYLLAFIPTSLHPRLWTAVFSHVCLTWLVQTVRRRFGDDCAMLLVLFVIVQFHIPFYASRMLMNTFGLGLSLVGVALYLDGRFLSALFVLVATSFAIRLDIFPLAVGVGLDYLLFGGKLQTSQVVCRFLSGCRAGLGGLALAGILSVLADSTFYGKFPMWAEMHVIHFNVIQNKSSVWGVQVWHWYLSDALPRALGLVFLFLFVKRYNFFTFRILLATVLIPVAILSLLPHKETRFIFPSIVFATLVASIQAVSFLRTSSSLVKNTVLPVVVLGTLAMSAIRLLVSSCNYPGGDTWAALGPFLRGQAPLSGLVLPWAVQHLVPASFVALDSQEAQRGRGWGLLNQTSSGKCSVFNGYVSEITGFSPFLSEDLPCTISRAEDGRRPGTKIHSTQEIKEHDWIVADPGAAGEVCDQFISVTYGFSRLDLKRLKIVLEPQVVVCT
jgi:alpha-1,6-mannosyltransferase